MKAFAVILLIMAILLKQGVAFSAQTDNDILSVEQKDRVGNVVHAAMLKCDAPGAILGIWQGEMNPYVIALGYADIEKSRKMSVEDGYRVGSVTKTFTATVILQLAEEKKLSLDDKLSKYFFTLPNADKITIRQVLAMTSGLPEVFADQVWSKLCSDNPQKDYSSFDVFNFICKGEPKFEPGEKCVYNQMGGYFILGLIIEQVLHEKVGEAISERIVEPLGLRYTYYPQTFALKQPFAKGYQHNLADELEEVWTSPTITAAAGAMVSNIYDLAVYTKALAKGTLVHKETNVARQEWNKVDGILTGGYQPLTADKRTVGICYGLGLMNFGGGIGHSGGIFGYNNIAVYFPGKDVTLVMMVNSNNNTREFLNAYLGVCAILFGEEFPFR